MFVNPNYNGEDVEKMQHIYRDCIWHRFLQEKKSFLLPMLALLAKHETQAIYFYLYAHTHTLSLFLSFVVTKNKTIKAEITEHKITVFTKYHEQWWWTTTTTTTTTNTVPKTTTIIINIYVFLVEGILSFRCVVDFSCFLLHVWWLELVFRDVSVPKFQN